MPATTRPRSKNSVSILTADSTACSRLLYQTRQLLIAAQDDTVQVPKPLAEFAGCRDRLAPEALAQPGCIYHSAYHLAIGHHAADVLLNNAVYGWCAP
jgi:hypothetical protein